MRRWSGSLVALALLILPATAWAAPVQKITITMRDFAYAPARIVLQAGIPVELTITNRGKVTHEFMLYGMPKDMGGMMGGEMGHEWVEKTNYFKGVPVTVQGGTVKRKAGAFFELRVPPGKTATLRFTPVKKGTFEFGCMIADHYEAGQRGVLVVK
ncbi:MAG TPA: cupredoxin domain-containing protein [bacterium]|nr:cupredoxin domain-containing protein [bacterium]